eukprot:XP_019918789.1 PREDICTED: uncharacterized protein LOC109617373 [Crassostrea gigas]
MESKSDIGNGPVINMERVPITEGQEIQRSDEKRANGIRNEGIKLRVKNIPVLEERRLLALERHIKRKRRRRPYVRKMKSSDKTEHQLGKTMVATNEKIPNDPGAFDFKNEGLQIFEGKEKEVRSEDEVEGTGMVVFDKYEKKQINIQATNDLIENFEVQSTKMNVAKDQQQDEQFDKLVEYVLDIVKSEIANKVEDELKSQSDFKHSQVKEESQIKDDEGAGVKVKQEKEEVNTSSPECARHVNDEDLKKGKENFQDEELKHLEIAKDNDNKIVDIGDENAEQSCNTSRTRSKEPTQKDPDDGDDGKTGFNTRNKVAIDDEKEEEEEEEDDDDDDEGFMPRKLFFFSFSEFKKEETSA